MNKAGPELVTHRYHTASWKNLQIMVDVIDALPRGVFMPPDWAVATCYLLRTCGAVLMASGTETS